MKLYLFRSFEILYWIYLHQKRLGGDDLYKTHVSFFLSLYCVPVCFIYLFSKQMFVLIRISLTSFDMSVTDETFVNAHLCQK